MGTVKIKNVLSRGGGRTISAGRRHGVLSPLLRIFQVQIRMAGTILYIVHFSLLIVFLLSPVQDQYGTLLKRYDTDSP